MDAVGVDAYLAECRDLTLREIQEVVPRAQRNAPLYSLMLDYPLRQAKALRPALAIATCRALGGPLESVLRSAAALELYHNAFLIHDDVEDGSEMRRDKPTLHTLHGVPIAVNVGDAMLALSLQPLLDNMSLIGMGKALRILQLVARMARESAEGQAIELQWIRDEEWNLSDGDYLRMVHKKTGWYSFITPVLIGGIVCNAEREKLARLRRFAALIGVAFQIQDDVLNLVGEGDRYGKEIAGDLLEGKHTLILMHALRGAEPGEREQALAILRKPRPSQGGEWQAALAALAEAGELTSRGRESLEARLGGGGAKTHEDIEFLRRLIDRRRSIAYARDVALRFARRARRTLEEMEWMKDSTHRAFLDAVVGFVVDRDR